MTLTKELALAIVAVGVLAGCGRPPVSAAMLATEASKRVTFPHDMGDGYRLDAITAEGNTVVSTVTLTDAALASDPRFVDVMRAATVSDICREIAPASQAYVDAGLAIAKVYRNAEGAELLRVEVRPADCG